MDHAESAAGWHNARPHREAGAWRPWPVRYATRLAVIDVIVLVWVVFGVQIVWFGFATSDVELRDFGRSGLVISYTVISVLVIGIWMLALTIYGTRGYREIGTGSGEYRLVADSTVRVFGLVAIVAFLFRIDIARGYVLLAFPLGLVFLLLGRWLARQWLTAKRVAGHYMSRVVVAGSPANVTHVVNELSRSPQSGYRVVGACIPGGLKDAVQGAPVLGGLDDVSRSMRLSGADTVVIAGADDLSPEQVRELSWSLEPGREHLIVAPSLIDVGGPRIHTRPVAGLPLMHVEMPRYTGAKLVAKRAFDIVGSFLAICVLSPVMIAVAIAVASTSKGGIFYVQRRVGSGGREFPMFKFRSMVDGADASLPALLNAQGTSDKPLFKVQNDPRLTPIGDFLRKYSLDELPQLFNVFLGHMSLVGPRPQRSTEMALYHGRDYRRLLLKPGISGLWQVSGRSDVAWEEAIRMDLYYVENWSLTGDVVILWRTARAVVARSGAY
ncbi:sugar transferase [Planctomonas sp. JC2975]|uniref:sugar transferase n=1 Tax=Planctomonas sp. JC2975 TaxID=2729626 RepID=UPI003211D1CA